MKKDLKLIKKKYGENMSRLCRKLFPTLLETDGLLLGILLNNFDTTRLLYDDIKDNNLEEEFRKYIYSLVEEPGKVKLSSKKTPRELLDEAGYILYECKSEEQIQSFKKYYALGEELCTFKGGRLEKCTVFFAVKKDVDNIRREEFLYPQRDDLYGTSVISIQFTKDDAKIMEIKNRYNHKANNPDATFSNNLDNIIPGLTESFEREYDLASKYKNGNLKIPGYILASDGKYYKYNYKINNIYYCPNNKIIDRSKVLDFNKSLCIVLDYFILDFKNKRIVLYDGSISDSFVKSITDIKNINLRIEGENKVIDIVPNKGEIITITLDKADRIIGVRDHNLRVMADNYLSHNEKLEVLDTPNVEIIGNSCFKSNKTLKEISLKKARIVGNNFFYNDKAAIGVNLPLVEKIGNGFFCFAEKLEKVNLDSITEIGDNFLAGNKNLKELVALKLKKIGSRFLYINKGIERIIAPSLNDKDNLFLQSHQSNSDKIFFDPLSNNMNILFSNSDLDERNLNNTNRRTM